MLWLALFFRGHAKQSSTFVSWSICCPRVLLPFEVPRFAYFLMLLVMLYESVMLDFLKNIWPKCGDVKGCFVGFLRVPGCSRGGCNWGTLRIPFGGIGEP